MHPEVVQGYRERWWGLFIPDNFASLEALISEIVRDHRDYSVEAQLPQLEECKQTLRALAKESQGGLPTATSELFLQMLSSDNISLIPLFLEAFKILGGEEQLNHEQFIEQLKELVQANEGDGKFLDLVDNYIFSRVNRDSPEGENIRDYIENVGDIYVGGFVASLQKSTLSIEEILFNALKSALWYNNFADTAAYVNAYLRLRSQSKRRVRVEF